MTRLIKILLILTCLSAASALPVAYYFKSPIGLFLFGGFAIIMFLLVALDLTSNME